MATWSDYTDYVDSYLSKLTPDAYKEARRLMRETGHGWTASKKKLTELLQGQLGMDPARAKAMALLAGNVVVAGNEDVAKGRDAEGNVFWNGSGAGTKLLDRVAYKSDADYHAAVLKAFGLEGEPTKGGTGPDGTGPAAPDTGGTGWEGAPDIETKLQQFIAAMGVSDPAITAQLQQRAQAQASGARGKAGLGSVGSYGGGGGLSAMGQQSINAGLDTQYAMQRAGLASQAMGQLASHDVNMSQIEQQYAAMRDGQIGQKWQAQQNQTQALWGTLGGIGGAAISAYTGIPGLGQAGAQGAAGVAGAFSGGNGPAYGPATGAGNRGSRGLGATGY
jgi:hypothetical protein